MRRASLPEVAPNRLVQALGGEFVLRIELQRPAKFRHGHNFFLLFQRLVAAIDRVHGKLFAGNLARRHVIHAVRVELGRLLELVVGLFQLPDFFSFTPIRRRAWPRKFFRRLGIQDDGAGGLCFGGLSRGRLSFTAGGAACAGVLSGCCAGNEAAKKQKIRSPEIKRIADGIVRYRAEDCRIRDGAIGARWLDEPRCGMLAVDCRLPKRGRI